LNAASAAATGEDALTDLEKSNILTAVRESIQKRKRAAKKKGPASAPAESATKDPAPAESAAEASAPTKRAKKASVPAESATEAPAAAPSARTLSKTTESSIERFSKLAKEYYEDDKTWWRTKDMTKEVWLGQTAYQKGKKFFPKFQKGLDQQTMGESIVDDLRKRAAIAGVTDEKANEARTEISTAWRKRHRTELKKPPLTKSTSYFVVDGNLPVFELQSEGGTEAWRLDGHLMERPVGQLSLVRLITTVPDRPPEYFIVRDGQPVSWKGTDMVFRGSMRASGRNYAVLHNRTDGTFIAVDPLALSPPNIEACIGCGVEATVACSGCATRLCGACGDEHLSECTE
jgi:hypothetical protein